MIPYKLADQKFSLPESWNEITLRQWLQLRTIDAKDICAVLSIFTGIPKETFYQARDIDYVEKMIPNLQWIATPIDLKELPVPSIISLNGETVVVPKDISIKTFGQKLMYQNEMVKHLDGEGNVKIEFLPMNLAIYLCKDPFSDENVAAILPHIEQLPIVHAYPTGAFFLSSFRESLLTKKST